MSMQDLLDNIEQRAAARPEHPVPPPGAPLRARISHRRRVHIADVPLQRAPRPQEGAMVGGGRRVTISCCSSGGSPLLLPAIPVQSVVARDHTERLSYRKRPVCRSRLCTSLSQGLSSGA